MVFGGGAFGSCLGLDEVTSLEGEAPTMEWMLSEEEMPGSSHTPSQRPPSRRGAVRRQLSTVRKKALTTNGVSTQLDLGLCSLQNYKQ